MEKVSKKVHNGKEVLVLDYSNQRGDGMIEVFETAKSLVQIENKHVVVLNVLNENTFINSNFMQHVRQHLPEVEGLVDKQAVIGLTVIQKWIVKGMNLWYERKIYSFDSIDEALEFLTADELKQKFD